MPDSLPAGRSPVIAADPSLAAVRTRTRPGVSHRSAGGRCEGSSRRALSRSEPRAFLARGNRGISSGLTNTRLLDLEQSLYGRRLCENTVGLLEERGISTWQSAGAADNSEWVNQIRTVTTLIGPYQLQESIHANYWGQMAMRNCLRQAYDGGAPRSGRCVRTANGLNGQGEPNMGLQ